MATETECFDVGRGVPLRWVSFTTTAERTDSGQGLKTTGYRVSYEGQDVGVVSKSEFLGRVGWVGRSMTGEVLVSYRDQRGAVYHDMMRDHLVSIGRLPEGTR